MKEILNYNMPDDGHGGLLTPGYLMEDDEDYFVLTKIRFEFICSSLIRMLNVPDMALRLMAYKCSDYAELPEQSYPGTNKSTRKQFKVFINCHKKDYVAIKTKLLKELHGLLNELWLLVRDGSRINHCFIGEYFRVIFDNSLSDGTLGNYFEIIGFSREEFDQFYHSSLIWLDDCGSALWDN